MLHSEYLMWMRGQSSVQGSRSLEKAVVITEKAPTVGPRSQAA
jgi:hypothetical protein